MIVIKFTYNNIVNIIIIIFAHFSAMEKWKKMSYMVAIYMFFIELRPLEPYMTAYQIGPDGNVSFYEVIISCIYL